MTDNPNEPTGPAMTPEQEASFRESPIGEHLAEWPDPNEPTTATERTIDQAKSRGCKIHHDTYIGTEKPIPPKAEQRAPMLSDAAIEEWFARVHRTTQDRHDQPEYFTGYMIGMEAGRAFYEGRITSGELMVRDDNLIFILKAFVKSSERNGCKDAAEGSPLFIARQHLARVTG